MHQIQQVLCFLSVLCVASVLADPQTEDGEHPEERQRGHRGHHFNPQQRQNFQACLTETEADKGKIREIMKSLINKQVTDPETVDSKEKCFFKCMFTRRGMIDEDGHFTEMMISMLESEEFKKEGSENEEAKEDLKKCFDSVSGIEDTCEKVYGFIMCTGSSEKLNMKHGRHPRPPQQEK